jgi:hypothetical protein
MCPIGKISFLPAGNPGAASARVFSPSGQLYCSEAMLVYFTKSKHTSSFQF